MANNSNNQDAIQTNQNTNSLNAKSGNNYQMHKSNSGFSEEDENQQETASNDVNEVTIAEENTTTQAANASSGPAASKLASNRRDASEVSSRANEATDRNDSGSGGISAGGAKSGSSLQ